MHVKSATTQETRIIEETKRRVESYADHEPLYDFDDNKKVQSRGTEAVLNALILVSADAGLSPGLRPGKLSEPTKLALQHLWQTQRPDGAWDWLNFGLEPFETVDATYFGATLAAMAIGLVPDSSSGADATRLASTETNSGIEKLRGYLKTQFASQSLFNRTWLLLASTHFKDLLTDDQKQALIKEIEGRQLKDGGWALETLGPWKWSKPAAPFAAPGTRDASLLAQTDGYATGLIVYTLRQTGLPLTHPAVSKGLQWLKANQREVQVKGLNGPAWRAHSLNYDREHGGDKGEPWRRMFMSDSATAFAVLALVGSEEST
jgi:squalene-hopene/tetraprenyl-beta-curcumene cyclase